MTSDFILQLVERLRSGDRGALARAITLLESARAFDIPQKTELLNACANLAPSSIRVAITGTPGVGKSSLIEHIGLYLIANGHRVAVLAVDPSSTKTGGSILGDKTRMTLLSKNPNAFIRPSPTSGILGGVTASTRETIMACEAAGYDRILIETVGVGQSETAASKLCDLVLFVTMAGSGDALQGIKRGVLESVDLVAVNKADGTNVESSKTFAHELQSALHLLHGSDTPPNVVLTSAQTQNGISDVVSQLHAIAQKRRESGTWATRRNQQWIDWYEDAIQLAILKQVAQSERLSVLKSELKKEVAEHKRHPFEAAQTFADTLFET